MFNTKLFVFTSSERFSRVLEKVSCKSYFFPDELDSTNYRVAFCPENKTLLNNIAGNIETCVEFLYDEMPVSNFNLIVESLENQNINILFLVHTSPNKEGNLYKNLVRLIKQNNINAIESRHEFQKLNCEITEYRQLALLFENNYNESKKNWDCQNLFNEINRTFFNQRVHKEKLLELFQLCNNDPDFKITKLYMSMYPELKENFIHYNRYKNQDHPKQLNLLKDSLNIAP